MAQKLKEIMTQNIATVSPQQSIQEATQLMSQHNVGSIPVVENGNCVGIVTDRDIALRAVSQGQNPSSTTVQSVMTSGVVTGSPEMDVHEAANLMAERQVRRLPVVENGSITGMVALGDLATQNIYQNEASQALTEISQPASPVSI
ncbi:putative signal-transduction protein with CBS domains [Desulforamulus reducens MI-1]|uniref:Putative signal-transduction protein with CBS domains n=1 Tax=Desulforamulus reducens (strain ATCC BAA-1160 / DSM 100696 / MI-1) TaxID=349161 RepID=A4J1P0_DESRM|nr:CBS domain-containing protein [Desulforamulus reducens]ABO48993.1 putative signal-transduction protein with CBS domains [Desulforamulus reducens MI-1]